MTTLSVPLSANLEEIVNSFVKSGFASNKAEVMRKALIRLSEEEAIKDVLEAQQEVRDGKILKGNIRDVLKKMNNA
jgi:Arc/MetJ-type ribon-helix-helix transcriptional regulator